MIHARSARRGGLGLVLAASAFLVSCAAEKSVPEDTVARAQAALAPLKKELMGALSGAMAQGGPVQAVEVCRVQAPAIAAAVAGDGVEVGRTSHRLRNPDNAPSTWMRPLLEHYVAHPADAVPRTVRVDAEHAGYVEPIRVKALCLACHGESIDDALATKLDELYPADEATGFREGDFRGLFWVTLRDEAS